MEISRLRKRAEFVLVTKTGNKWVTPGIVVQALRKSDENTTVRVGFTATKRTGNAVTRNRIKRRLRALAKEIIPQSKRISGHDIVLIGRYTTATRNFDALRQDLTTALKKLGVK